MTFDAERVRARQAAARSALVDPLDTGNAAHLGHTLGRLAFEDMDAALDEIDALRAERETLRSAMVVSFEKEHRAMQDACLVLWANLPLAETREMRAECPELVDFLVHLHHQVEHEQAMVRQNVWATAVEGAQMGSERGVGAEAE